MDKDHERERKHQQNERQQIVVSTDHQPSVDEHFEESLRRAKEKERVSWILNFIQDINQVVLFN